jgi:hypothetical protein
MPTILQWCDRDTLKIEAGATIYAGVRENFTDVKGGHKCKLCGDVVGHPRAAAAHLAVHHREALEACDSKMRAGGPGSGRHKRDGKRKAANDFFGPSAKSKDDKSWEAEVDLVDGHTKMTAGGPGSGRHKGDGEGKGWFGKTRNLNTRFRRPEPDGSWDWTKKPSGDDENPSNGKGWFGKTHNSNVQFRRPQTVDKAREGYGKYYSGHGPDNPFGKK